MSDVAVLTDTHELTARCLILLGALRAVITHGNVDETVIGNELIGDLDDLCDEYVKDADLADDLWCKWREAR